MSEVGPDTSPPSEPPSPWWRVEVTATRLTLRPPCACPPIPLARGATALDAIQDLDCPACEIAYQIAFLGHADQRL